MKKKITNEKISNLAKTSPTFWPLGVALGSASMLVNLVILAYLPIFYIKLLLGLSGILLIVSIYKWMMLLLNSKDK